MRMTSHDWLNYHGVLLPGRVQQKAMREIAKDPGLQEEYKKLHGHAEKEEFRRKFLEAKLAAAKDKLQVKQQKHTIVDSSKGSYMSFYRIWEQEGKDEAGFKAIWAYSSLPQALHDTAETSSASLLSICSASSQQLHSIMLLHLTQDHVHVPWCVNCSVGCRSSYGMVGGVAWSMPD